MVTLRGLKRFLSGRNVEAPMKEVLRDERLQQVSLRYLSMLRCKQLQGQVAPVRQIMRKGFALLQKVIETHHLARKGPLSGLYVKFQAPAMLAKLRILSPHDSMLGGGDLSLIAIGSI